MAKNTNLQQAKAAKADEFYTQLTDIEKELYHYKDHFKGKTVLCNCDDPRVSNFFRFFAMHFEDYGLKRLITTCYKNQDVDLFSQGTADKAVYLIYEGDKNGNGLADPEELEVKPLKGDGDFRSAECIELLKQADIVVTNPPFSLFREYVAQLMKYEKKFLIIGRENIAAGKELFSLIKDNKIWLGCNSGDMSFRVPDNYEMRETRSWRDDDGVNWRSLGNACWYTNLEHQKRHKPKILCKKYSSDIYPRYYNYDAIDVSRVDDIPEDYFGEMGVPISLLHDYCPEQFEIIGNGPDVPKNKEHISFKDKGFIAYVENGNIVWKTPYTVSERKLGNSLRLEKNGEPANAPFSRIIIRRK